MRRTMQMMRRQLRLRSAGTRLEHLEKVITRAANCVGYRAAVAKVRNEVRNTQAAKPPTRRRQCRKTHLQPKLVVQVVLGRHWARCDASAGCLRCAWCATPLFRLRHSHMFFFFAVEFFAWRSGGALLAFHCTEGSVQSPCSRRTRRGVVVRGVWCVKCGGVLSRCPRWLAFPCTGHVTSRSRDALARLSRGLSPRGVVQPCPCLRLVSCLYCAPALVW